MVKKKTVYWSSCKVSVTLSTFSWKFNFLGRFSKNTQVTNFVKIRLVWAQLFHADWRTDMIKLTVVFVIL